MSGPISLRIDRLKSLLDADKIAKEAFPTFYKNTPIRSGNARKNTLVDKGEIKADYAYATRLDRGYSKQKPEGMTKPTLDYIRSYIRNIGRK